MKKVSALLALLIGVAATGTAFAHPDHDDAPPAILYKVDLVKKKDGATFHVTQKGEKVSTAGATGKLILTKGKSKSEVTLQPAGDNTMVTAKPTKLAKGTNARAMINFADSTNATEDFLIK